MKATSMGTMRTPQTEAAYKAYIDEGGLAAGCVLCAKPALKEFRSWKIIKNDFPYDKIAMQHDMIIPLRHAAQDEVTNEEWQELNEIKESYIHPTYEWMMEATNIKKSIPSHFHIHLVIAAD